jgi:hypothetical protein
MDGLVNHFIFTGKRTHTRARTHAHIYTHNMNISTYGELFRSIYHRAFSLCLGTVMHTTASVYMHTRGLRRPRHR